MAQFHPALTNYGDDDMSYGVPWGWYFDDHAQKDDRGVRPFHRGLEEFRGIHWDPALARKIQGRFQTGRTAQLINEVGARALRSADLHTMLSERDRLSFTTGQLTGVLETVREVLASVTLRSSAPQKLRRLHMGTAFEKPGAYLRVTPPRPRRAADFELERLGAKPQLATRRSRRRDGAARLLDTVGTLLGRLGG